MKLGFIGLPGSGKTTIFNALTGFEAEIGYVHKNVVNKAYVEVLDKRVVNLSKIYKPVKTTFSGLEVFDFAKSDDENIKDYFNGPEVKLLDAVAIVLRFFHDDIINGECGLPDPERDLKILEHEFILSDLMIAEKRLDRVKANLKRGVKGVDNPAEEKLLEKIIESLYQEKPVRTMDLTKEEEFMIKSFQLLSQKPILIIINTDEENLKKVHDLKCSLIERGYEVVDVVGKYEMELVKLDENDASLFLQEIGYDDFAKQRIIHAAFSILDIIHFFTVGEKDVRAWAIVKGSSAPEAAGKIHNDLEKGFIRAECFSCEEFMECGSEKALKEKGKIRLEGKSYIVKDGDILFIRFGK